MSKILLGNLKMNMTQRQIVSYLKNLKQLAKHTTNIVGVTIPYPYLHLAKKYLSGSNVLYGAQNVYFENEGAFTGEVSIAMLSDYNTDFCLVGHSERRAYFNENDIDINKKVLALSDSAVVPVLCVGENLSERKTGKHKEVVSRQIELALKGLNVEDVTSMVFAYEPVWAIGTGVSATSEQAEEMAKYIKYFVSEKFSLSFDKICVIYGGSINNNNYLDILSQPDIDGGLVGGACLDVKKFSEIFGYKK